MTLQAFRSKIKFHTNPRLSWPSLSWPSFEQLGPGQQVHEMLSEKNYSDKKKTNKQKQKLKYWHQSTSNGMKNNQMKRLASGSNENLDYFVMVTRFNHNGSFT